MNQTVLSPDMLRICIDANHEGILSGRVYNSTYQKEILFEDLGNMIVDMDKLFDYNGFPQSFQNRRSFQNNQKPQIYHYKPDNVVNQGWFFSQKGKLSTFTAIVLTRQHSSWQGELYNDQDELLIRYNDVMDLLAKIEKEINKNS